MTLSDRRLLIELSAVLAIKLAIIVLLKVHFFSPAPVDHQHPVTTGEATAPQVEPEGANPEAWPGADKER